MTEIPKSISDYMANIGQKGGKAGKGSKKKRSPEHYAKMAASRNKKKRRK